MWVRLERAQVREREEGGRRSEGGCEGVWVLVSSWLKSDRSLNRARHGRTPHTCTTRGP